MSDATQKSNLKLVHDRERSPPPPIVKQPFRHLETLGYGPYILSGGNPRSGKLSPNSKIKPDNFGKVPVELGEDGLYRGAVKWTRKAETTRGELIAWQKAGDNQLLRTGKIPTFPDDAPAIIALDCDAETAEMSAAFLALAEKKFGRLSLRRRNDKPHRWLALVQGIEGAGDIAPIRVVYTDRDGRKARMEILSRGGECVAGGANSNGATWEWPNGMTPLSELKKATLGDILDLEKECRAEAEARGCLLKGGVSVPGMGPRVPRQRRSREECTCEEWVNQTALDRLDDWVPDFFPAARRSGDTYRVSPDDLGRTCEEDLSFHPTGIQDFGQEQEKRVGYTPIGLLQAFFCGADEHGDPTPAEFDGDDAPIGNMPADQATEMLCECLGIDWRAEAARAFLG
jgi:hypothetical protein